MVMVAEGIRSNLRHADDSRYSRGHTARNRHWPVENGADSFDCGLQVRRAGIAVWKPGDFWERSRADTLGIELVISGNVRLIQDGREHLVEPDHVYLLYRGARHFYETGPSGWVRKRYIGMGGPLLDQILIHSGLADVDVVDIRPVRGRVGALMREVGILIRCGAHQLNRRLSVLAYDLLLEIAGCVRRRPPPIVERAMAFIQAHLYQPVTVAEIARSAGISPSRLTVVFRTHLHTTPKALHTRMRIEAASRLLKQSTRPIKEIAMQMGFDDPLHFSRVYRSTLGVSPRQYRQGAVATPPDPEHHL